MITLTDYSRTAVRGETVFETIVLKLRYVLEHEKNYKVHCCYRKKTQELRVYWNGKICFNIGLAQASDLESGIIFDLITDRPCRHFT